MEDSSSLYQKCNKMNCNFYTNFRLFLNHSDIFNHSHNSCNFILGELQKRLVLFVRPFCKYVNFLDFEKAANEKNSYFIEKRTICWKTS